MHIVTKNEVYTPFVFCDLTDCDTNSATYIVDEDLYEDPLPAPPPLPLRRTQSGTIYQNQLPGESEYLIFKHKAMSI